MRRVVVRSVLVGGLIDAFCSSFLGAVSVVVVLLILSIAHTPPDSVAAVTSDIVHANPLFIAAQVVIGAGCSLLGGYIAARLAGHDERLNGAASSVVSLVSGIVAIALGHDPQQLTLHVLILPVKPALGYVGGYLRASQVRRVRVVEAAR
jgi:hypothetical protein